MRCSRCSLPVKLSGPIQADGDCNNVHIETLLSPVLDAMSEILTGKEDRIILMNSDLRAEEGNEIVTKMQKHGKVVELDKDDSVMGYPEGYSEDQFGYQDEIPNPKILQVFENHGWRHIPEQYNIFDGRITCFQFEECLPKDAVRYIPRSMRKRVAIMLTSRSKFEDVDFICISICKTKIPLSLKYQDYERLLASFLKMLFMCAEFGVSDVCYHSPLHFDMTCEKERMGPAIYTFRCEKEGCLDADLYNMCCPDSNIRKFLKSKGWDIIFPDEDDDHSQIEIGDCFTLQNPLYKDDRGKMKQVRVGFWYGPGGKFDYRTVYMGGK